MKVISTSLFRVCVPWNARHALKRPSPRSGMGSAVSESLHLMSKLLVYPQADVRGFTTLKMDSTNAGFSTFAKVRDFSDRFGRCVACATVCWRTAFQLKACFGGWARRKARWSLSSSRWGGGVSRDSWRMRPSGRACVSTGCDCFPTVRSCKRQPFNFLPRVHVSSPWWNLPLKTFRLKRISTVIIAAAD